MRVHVEDTVWQDRTAYGELQRLMRRAATGQHMVTADFFEAVEPFLDQAVAPVDRLEWEELLTRTLGAARNAPKPARQAIVTVGQQFNRSLTDGFQLAPSDVGRWSEEPLMVLLENDNDWLLV